MGEEIKVASKFFAGRKLYTEWYRKGNINACFCLGSYISSPTICFLIRHLKVV